MARHIRYLYLRIRILYPRGAALSVLLYERVGLFPLRLGAVSSYPS